MKKCSALAAAALIVGIAVTDLSLAQPAGPISREEAQRQTRVFEELTKALAAETTDAVKFIHIAKVMKDERDVNFRRRILDTAVGLPGPDLEKFLTNLLTGDKDAGLRSYAATTLGRLGSENCLTALVDTAKNDRTTEIQVGDIAGRSSARRAATFAVAEFAGRFPKLAEKAAAELRALPIAADAKDNEHLADARVQALYQITRDQALLKPFYEKLKSNDPSDRARGVTAFRFLKLKEAPAEIVDALQDADADVRRTSALVLGEIGDAKTGAALMKVAGDAKEEVSVRCNAISSLGHMKTAAAGDLMEKLLTDPTLIVQTNAAIALYRITGKKVKQFPAGYRVD
jgi:HEAT repeat protein